MSRKLIWGNEFERRKTVLNVLGRAVKWSEVGRKMTMECVRVLWKEKNEACMRGKLERVMRIGVKGTKY